MSEIMAFDPSRRTSAQAILDLANLGYLNVNQTILDATYGKGRFWSRWWPNDLYTNDLSYERAVVYHDDYRELRWAANRFDVTVFDPPFKLNGTGGSHPSDEAYGVAGAYDGDRVNSMWAGLDECFRVTKPGGIVLFKTQDQVSGGKRRWLSKDAVLIAEADCDPPRARLLDELYITGYRKQPVGRPQKHSRSNVSVLQVYRKAR